MSEVSSQTDIPSIGPSSFICFAIAMESMGNTLSVIFGHSDDDFIEDYEDLKEAEEDPPLSDFSSPPLNECQQSSVDLTNSPHEMKSEDVDLLECSTQPRSKNISNGNLQIDQESESDTSQPKKLSDTSSMDSKSNARPKLATGTAAKTGLGHSQRTSSFASRKPLHRGRGKILGEIGAGAISSGGVIGSG